MLGDIDYSKQPLIPKLYICKPNINRIPIAYMKEVYDITYKEKLSNINELNFKILYELNLDTNSQINPNIEHIKERYIVKLIIGNIEEYFIINKVIDIMDDEDLIKEVQCYSYSYTLSDKIISQFKAESYNATKILSSVLAETNWNIDFIDPSFDNVYRTFDIQSKSVLNMVLSIGETFNGTIKFDTVNRKISLYVNEKIGYDKGLTFSYGRYLAGINKEQNIDDFCTRLKCFGKDSLTINSVNPTGKNYLDDFTFFLFPFERDINRNVITSSYYFSNELCHALLDWKNKLNDNTTVFNNLLNQKDVTNNLLTVKDTELSALNVQLTTIKSELDTAQNLSTPIYALSIEKTSKENQISSKTSEINKLNIKLNKLNQQIYNLQNSLALENNLSPAYMVELNDFIIQKEWSDTNYIDAKDLYIDGIKKLNELRNPVTQIEIDIVNFLDYIEEQLNWDKIGLGDTVYVKMDIMSINVQCKITQIERNFENSEIKLTITNVKDIETNEDKYIKLMRDSISVFTTVSNNKSKWDNASDIANSVYEIINNPWDANSKSIYAGVNNSTTIDNRGIICSDKDNPNKFIRINNNSVIYTEDGGKSYTTLINNGTIAGDKINGEIILGDNLTIRNANKSILINKDSITIANTALKITNGLTEDNLGDQVTTWNNSSLNFNIRNDRISVIPANPTLPETGVIDYTKNTDSSCNISFEWDYDINIDDAHNIDGFTVYVYNSSTISTSYIFGTDVVNEKVYNIDYNNNAMILNGVAIDNYYTFGIQAYRIVDPDINSNRIIASEIVQINNPYQPSSNVAFEGDITGTINGRNVVTVLETLDQANENANEAILQLTDISADNKITSTEKKVVQRDWDTIAGEYQTIIDQAANVGLDVSNYYVDNYIDMYTILNNYLVTNSILVDITTTSTVDRATFLLNFTNYYNAKIILLKEISAILSNNGVNIAIRDGIRNFTFDSDGNSLTTPSAYNVVVIQNGNIIVPTSITWSYSGFLSGNTSTPIVGSFTANDTYIQASVVVNGITYIERIPISGSKIGIVGEQGVPGTNGLNTYNMRLISVDGLIFKYDKNGNLISPNSIGLFANIYGVNDPTYIWYKDNIEIVGEITDGLIVSPFLENSHIYKCVVSGTSNDVNISIYDTVTITKVQDGSDSYSIVLSNESVTIPTDESGNNPILSTAFTDVILYKGINSISPTIGTLTNSNCTSSKTGNRVTILSLTGDSGYVDIEVKDGTTVIGTRQFTFSKSKQGIQGVSTLVSYVFKRSSTTPTTPTGGTYESPIPTGWYDSPPTGTDPLYMSKRNFYSDGTSGSWTTPVKIDGNSIKAQYSIDGSTSWHETFVAGDIYIRTSTDSGSTWSSAIRIVGEQGIQGVAGTNGKVYTLNIINGKRAILYNASGTTPTPAMTAFGCELYENGDPVTPETYLWIVPATNSLLSGSSSIATFTPTVAGTFDSTKPDNAVYLTIEYAGQTIKQSVPISITKIGDTGATGASGINGTNGKTYILNIINGYRTVLYNSDGTSYTPDMTQSPFSCSLYENGVSKTPTSYTWSIPSSNTMLTGVYSGYTYNTPTFVPTLASIFDSTKSNNTISLTVQYYDPTTATTQTITDIAPISITKIGTDGEYFAPAWIKSTTIDFTSVSTPSMFMNNGYINDVLKVGANASTKIYIDGNYPTGDNACIRAGKANYADDTAGFWMGLDSGAWKYKIGNSTNYLNWDGSSLKFGGNFYTYNQSGVEVGKFATEGSGVSAGAFLTLNNTTTGIEAFKVYADLSNGSNKTSIDDTVEIFKGSNDTLGSIRLEGGKNTVLQWNQWITCPIIELYDGALNNYTLFIGKEVAIFNTQNVGIGITNPGTYKLNVNGDINFTGNLYQNGELIFL